LKKGKRERERHWESRPFSERAKGKKERYFWRKNEKDFERGRQRPASHLTKNSIHYSSLSPYRHQRENGSFPSSSLLCRYIWIQIHVTTMLSNAM